MIVWTRRLWTLVLRLCGLLSHARWIVLSLALALLGLVDVVRDVPDGLSAVLAAVSVWLVVLEVRAHAAVARRTSFLERPSEDFADVKAALAGNPRFRFITTGGTWLEDLVAERDIAAGVTRARASSSGFVMPRQIRELGRLFQRRRVAQKDTYNGSVVGLDAPLGVGPALPTQVWQVTPARYWDYLATDRFAGQDVFVDGRPQAGYGRSLFIDRRGHLREPSDSWLLNNIGTSVLALTTDHRLVLVSQSMVNDSSRGQLAPSGSGSLEPQDLRGATELEVRTLARNGALRELQEETGLAGVDVTATAFLGFGRWLDKAAVPEMLTVARLRLDSHAVRVHQVPNRDRPYTLWVAPERVLLPPSQWDSDEPRSLLAAEHWGRLSMPLVAGLHALCRAAAAPSTPAGVLVHDCFADYR